MKTITTLENELKEIRKGVSKGKYQNGLFGIKACKMSIQWDMEYYKKPIQTIYAELVARALNELGFNTNMIVACELIMNEIGGDK